MERDPLRAEQAPAVDRCAHGELPGDEDPDCRGDADARAGVGDARRRSAPITPPSSIHHGWWTARAKPATLCCASDEDHERERRGQRRRERERLEHADAARRAATSDATWIEPASPAATASTDASALPDTARTLQPEVSSPPDVGQVLLEIARVGREAPPGGGSPLTGS